MPKPLRVTMTFTEEIRLFIGSKLIDLLLWVMPKPEKGIYAQALAWAIGECLKRTYGISR